MTDIIMKNGGTIDKYMGDCIMAFWNAPLACDNHAEMAVKSAIEIEVKTNELKEIYSAGLRSSAQNMHNIRQGLCTTLS